MKSFLVIQTAFIGDVVLATPVIEQLHRCHPDAAIDMLVRRGNESLLTGHPFLREVLVFDKKNGKYRNLLRMIRRIRSQRYDVVINLQRFAASGLMTALSGAGETIGFSKNPLSAFFSRRFPHVIAPGGHPVHEVERNLSLVRHLSDDRWQRPKLYPSPADFDKVRQDGPYVCMAPASVWFTKQWPADRWTDLARRIPADIAVHLLGSPGDRDLCERILRDSGRANVINQAGRLTFLESAALMAGARMNYVNDSAPLHFASAMNAPVTAIFCSTLPAFGFGPLSDVSVIAETKEQLPCRPCGLHGKKACPEGHFRCAEIEVKGFWE
jgi:heptosyltransferase-2